MDIRDHFSRFLNSDRYQYTESDVYLQLGLQNQPVVFDFFFRKTQDNGLAVVAGTESVLRLITLLNTASPEAKRAYFATVIHEPELLEYLSSLTFNGNIYAMREGEICFPYEPVMIVEGELIPSKIIETPLLNCFNYQMAIASKASRVTRVAHPAGVLAFGPRRAHGYDAAMMGTKAALIGGCAGHSSLATEQHYGVPATGSMSHSFIQSFGVGEDGEKAAFDAFTKRRCELKAPSIILLIDTYDTLRSGLTAAIACFKKYNLENNTGTIYGIRLDSGDLAYLSKQCRKQLDDEGLKRAQIVLSNGLNEQLIAELRAQGAPFDVLGVGDSIATSSDNPCFGGVYKLVSSGGKPVIKVSNDAVKTLTPAHKSVYRIYQNGEARADLITLAHNDSDVTKLKAGETITITSEGNRLLQTTFKADSYTIRELLEPMVLDGQLTSAGLAMSNLQESRDFYKQHLNTFSPECRRTVNPHRYKVNLSHDLYTLKYKMLSQLKKD